jgi:hypothetical protein
VAAVTDQESNRRREMQAKFFRQLSAVEYIGLGAAVALLAVVLVALAMLAASADRSEPDQAAAPPIVQQVGDGTDSVPVSAAPLDNVVPSTAVTVGSITECGYLGSECLSKDNVPDHRTAPHVEPGFIP